MVIIPSGAGKHSLNPLGATTPVMVVGASSSLQVSAALPAIQAAVAQTPQQTHHSAGLEQQFLASMSATPPLNQQQLKPTHLMGNQQNHSRYWPWCGCSSSSLNCPPST
jgi:hypothetical protein